jgi:hypothetical protein
LQAALKRVGAVSFADTMSVLEAGEVVVVPNGQHDTRAQQAVRGARGAGIPVVPFEVRGREGAFDVYVRPPDAA